MYRVVMIRHGESIWNRENLFTGWTDVPLSDRGVTEAQRAGDLLRDHRFEFDHCFTSMLTRAIQTLWIVQERMDLQWLPVRKSWRLNERHYGALQGRNKVRTAEEVGEEQVFRWRRGFDTRPPLVDISDPRFPGHDRRYREVDGGLLPRGESLKDTVQRVLPLWRGEIAPMIREEKCVLISAHGNSLRGLVKHLDGLSDEDVTSLEIPTGHPLVYELNQDLKPLEHYYLEDEGPSSHSK